MDYIAIGVGIGITLSVFTAILYYMIRGSRRLKEGKLVRTPRFAVNGQVSCPSTASSSVASNFAETKREHGASATREGPEAPGYEAGPSTNRLI